MSSAAVFTLSARNSDGLGTPAVPFEQVGRKIYKPFPAGSMKLYDSMGDYSLEI